MEGHPDNVAPALHGGFVISGRDDRGEAYAVGAPVDDRVSAAALRAARRRCRPRSRAGCCPTQVPHADAAADAGTAALLVAALGRPPRPALAGHP